MVYRCPIAIVNPGNVGWLLYRRGKPLSILTAERMRFARNQDTPTLRDTFSSYLHVPVSRRERAQECGRIDNARHRRNRSAVGGERRPRRRRHRCQPALPGLTWAARVTQQTESTPIASQTPPYRPTTTPRKSQRNAAASHGTKSAFHHRRLPGAAPSPARANTVCRVAGTKDAKRPGSRGTPLAHRIALAMLMCALAGFLRPSVRTGRACFRSPSATGTAQGRWLRHHRRWRGAVPGRRTGTGTPHRRYIITEMDE